MTSKSHVKTILIQTNTGGMTAGGFFRFSFQDSSFLFNANNSMSNSQCSSYFQSMPNFKTVSCSRYVTPWGVDYNVSIIAFPTYPHESNMVAASSNPPISYFGCDASLVTGYTSATCSIVDITSPYALLPGLGTVLSYFSLLLIMLPVTTRMRSTLNNVFFFHSFLLSSVAVQSMPCARIGEHVTSQKVFATAIRDSTASIATLFIHR